MDDGARGGGCRQWLQQPLKVGQQGCRGKEEGEKEEESNGVCLLRLVA